MPSGGYGLNEKDRQQIEAFTKDPEMRKWGMWFEWFWAYASARGQGATPQEAATAAYIEWDL